MDFLIQAKDLVKEYHDGTSLVKALDHVSLSITPGENLTIIGPSGSGKTTLLHILGGLDKPSTGEIVIDGHPLQTLNDSELSKFRNQTLGFIFQFFYLQDYLSALENVMMPQIIAGKNESKAREQALKLLKKVGLEHRQSHLPGALSGGEMQRVAIARALANNPKIILADEPTGNLDKANAEKVLELFDEIAKSDTSLIIITHDESISKRYGHTLKVHKGQISH